MPHKHNAARRHHIGKMNFKMMNWAEYDAGLRQRGSLTLWMTSKAVDDWAVPRRKTRGGQPRYPDLAIETALTLGLVFGLRLRRAEGFLTSVLLLMGLDLAVPDHTTLSRRANNWRSPDKRQCNVTDSQEKGPSMSSSAASAWRSTAPANGWKKKHGAKSRRRWQKLHLALDADSGKIIAHVTTKMPATPSRWRRCGGHSATRQCG
jgi:hypothetical protein